MNSPDHLHKLANERAGGAESLRLSWLQALNSLPELDGETFELLARALPSPAATRQLAIFLSREADPAGAVQQFLTGVDESGESLEAWLSAFEAFTNYIRGTAHRPTLSQALGYLHCCEAIIESGPRYETFPMAVMTMLETYGYEGRA